MMITQEESSYNMHQPYEPYQNQASYLNEGYSDGYTPNYQLDKQTINNPRFQSHRQPYHYSHLSKQSKKITP